MKTAGVIGIGDMGSGMAANLIASGYETFGFDTSAARLAAFAQAGGKAAGSAAEVGSAAQNVFVMVMTGEQAITTVVDNGLASAMAPGGNVIITATIRPSEVRAIGQALEGSGLYMIDSPVSGGRPGADAGTLTMMAAGSDEALASAEPAMKAVSATIHRVGTEPGMGQTVKACLTSLTGSIYSATFEATVLAAKSGITGQVLYDVLSTSIAANGATNMALQNIIDRQFEDTGSHIDTMYKDLTIALDLAREQGVPLFSASTAMQLFQAGKTRHPDGDNWVVTQVLEEIVSTGLKR